MFNQTAATEQLILVDGYKRKLGEQLGQFGILTAWGCVEGVATLLLRVAHYEFHYIIIQLSP